MANTIKLKRSSTPAAVPGSLSAGELAINLVDRKLYFGNGTSVVELSGAAVTVADAAPTSPTPRNGDLWWNSTTGELFIRFDDGSSAQWVAVLSGDLSGLAAHLADTDPHTDTFGDVYSDMDALAYERSRKNMLINGCFRVVTRTAGGAADLEFDALDRWKCLVDTTTLEATYTTDEAGGNYAGKFGLLAASSYKFGIMQILEEKDAALLRGKTVTFSVRLKASDVKLDDVRIAILSWTGTANVPTDPVSAWGSSGTNPTWSANWTAENTPADLNITTDWATYSVTADVDTSGMNNLAVVVFSNSSTPTTTERIHIDDAQLEVGNVFTAFEQRSYTEELALAQRYFQTISELWLHGYVSSVNHGLRTVNLLPVRMMQPPNITRNTAADLINCTSGNCDITATADYILLYCGTWSSVSATCRFSIANIKLDAEM